MNGKQSIFRLMDQNDFEADVNGKNDNSAFDGFEEGLALLCKFVKN